MLKIINVLAIILIITIIILLIINVLTNYKNLNYIYDKIIYITANILIALFASNIINKILMYLNKSGQQVRGGVYYHNNNIKYNQLDFEDKLYDEKIDDQAHLIIPEEEQTFMHKEYDKMVAFAYPKFDDTHEIPEKYKDKKPEEINNIIEKEILKGRDKHWTNKSLSYMRKDIQGKRLINCVFLPNIKKILKKEVEEHKIEFVDTTANIGGTSLHFALLPIVKHVKSYDLDGSAIDMLKNNVKLYGYEKKFTILNKRFDMEIPKNAVVSIDPPYEKGNNATNFNLSIENRPIYYVVEDILNKGAAIIFLETPSEFKYNYKFANDKKQFITVYTIPTKRIKIYMICKNDLMISEENFKSYNIIKDPYDDSLYSCKIVPSDTKKRAYFNKGG